MSSFNKSFIIDQLQGDLHKIAKYCLSQANGNWRVICDTTLRYGASISLYTYANNLTEESAPNEQENHNHLAKEFGDLCQISKLIAYSAKEPLQNKLGDCEVQQLSKAEYGLVFGNSNYSLFIRAASGRIDFVTQGIDVYSMPLGDMMRSIDRLQTASVETSLGHCVELAYKSRINSSSAPSIAGLSGPNNSFVSQVLNEQQALEANIDKIVFLR